MTESWHKQKLRNLAQKVAIRPNGFGTSQERDHSIDINLTPEDHDRLARMFEILAQINEREQLC